MTKEELLKAIQDNTMGPRCWSEIDKAVDEYASEPLALLREVRQRLLFGLDGEGEIASSMTDLMDMWERVNNVLANQPK